MVLGSNPVAVTRTTVIMKCVCSAKFQSTWFSRDNLRQKLQVFSCFHQRFETWGIAFTSSTLICCLFILFNYYYISFHKDSLKVNKNKVWFIADKESIEKKQSIEYLLKRTAFFVANGRYRLIYAITVNCRICVVWLNLMESQRNPIQLFYFMLKN